MRQFNIFRQIIVFLLLLLIYSCVNKNRENVASIDKHKYSYRFFYINNDTVRYDYSSLNGKYDGCLTVKVNNKLIHSQYVENDTMQGEFKIYYLNGNIMYDGQMKNSGLIFLKEYDEEGRLKNENFFCELYPITNEKGVSIFINCFEKYNFDEPCDFAYSFYEIINNQDTVALMEETYKKIPFDFSELLIPFEYVREGKFLFQYAFPTVENYECWLKLYSFNFEIDKNGEIHYDEYKLRPISLDLKYPYTLILDTLFYDNYDELSDKADMTLEYMVR